MSQSDATRTTLLLLIHQDWHRVYTRDCGWDKTGTQIAGGAGASFTIATPGSYIIGIKYDPKSIVGTPVPVPATVTYNSRPLPAAAATCCSGRASRAAAAPVGAAIDDTKGRGRRAPPFRSYVRWSPPTPPRGALPGRESPVADGPASA